MAGSFLAEILKLRKRPATWVVALIWVIIIAFNFFSTYAFAKAPIPEDTSSGATVEEASQEPAPGEATNGEATNGQTAPAGQQPPPGEEEIPPEVEEQIRAEQEAFNQAFLESVYPDKLLSNMFSGGTFTIVGGALLLVLGAMTAGSEYGWGTLKTMLTQRPGRIGALLGKLLALGVVLLLFMLLGFAAGALCSFIIALLEDAAVEWPALAQMLRGLGAATLILAVWALFGFTLAVLLRGIAFAIAFGAFWLLGVEGIIFQGFLIENETFENIREFLPGENASSLAAYFGSPLPEEFAFPIEPLVEPGRAVATLAVYAVVFILISALLLWRRDVT